MTHNVFRKFSGRSTSTYRHHELLHHLPGSPLLLSPPSTITRIVIATTASAILPLLVSGQGTVDFIGFEEYPFGSIPPFVTNVFPDSMPTEVANTKTWRSTTFQPFEGQKLLGAQGSITLESPNGQLIQSFSLHLTMAQPPAGSSFDFSIAGDRPIIQQFGSWQLFEGSFTSPVKGVRISAYYNEGERFGLGYAVDAVEFTTIPEPQTVWLLTLGFSAILVRRSKYLKNRSG